MATAIPTLEELEKLPVAPSPSPGPIPSKVPSLEELEALGMVEAPVEGPVIQEPGMLAKGAGITAQTLRSAAKGRSLGASEAYFAGVNSIVATLLGNGQADKAKSFLDQVQANFYADLKAQEEFEKKYPVVSGTAEMLSQIGPIPKVPTAVISELSEAAGAAKKFGEGVGKELPKYTQYAKDLFGGTQTLAEGLSKVAPEAKTLGQTAKEIAKAGAVFGGGQQAIKEATYAAGGQPLDSGSMIGRMAEATALGAAAPLAVGGTFAGGAKVVGKLGTSTAAMRVIQVLRGIPVKTQQKYLELKEIVDGLKSPEEVASVFDNAREVILREAKESREKAVDLKKYAEDLDAQIEKQVREKKGQISEGLADAREYLKQIRDELSLEIQGVPGTKTGAGIEAEKAKALAAEEVIGPVRTKAEELGGIAKATVAGTRAEAQRAASIATEALKAKAKQEQVPASQFVPEVESALRELKKRVSEASEEAISTLPDDVYIPTSVIFEAIRAQKQQVKLGGLGTAESRSFLKLLEDMERSYAENLPLNLPPTQAKAVLQDLSKTMETTPAARFAGREQDALYQIYRALNAKFDSFTEYKEKMIPVKELAAFIDQNQKQLDSPSKIRSFLERAVKDPMEQGILEKLEQYTGYNVTSGPKQISAARQLSTDVGLRAAIESLPEVKEYEALKSQLLRQTDPAVRAQLEQRLPILKEAADAKIDLIKAQDPAALEQLYQRLPEVKRLQELKALVELSTNRNFENAVFANVKDTEMGQAIVTLRRSISELSNPEYRKLSEMQIRQSAGGTLAEAAMAANTAEERYQLWKQIGKPFRGKETGSTIVEAMVRNPNGVQSDLSIRMMRALSELPEQQLSELFSELGVTNKEKLATLIQALRVNKSFEQEFIRGSRLVTMISAPFKAIADFTAKTNPGAQQGVINGLFSGLAAIAPWIGGILDTFGSSMAKIYLKAASDLQGVPSYSKLIKSLPQSEAVAGSIAQYVSHLSSQINKASVIEVSSANQAQVEHDIKTSMMSPIDKARASNQVQNGFIEGGLLKKLMLDGVKSQEPPLAARMVRFTQ